MSSQEAEGLRRCGPEGHNVVVPSARDERNSDLEAKVGVENEKDEENVRAGERGWLLCPAVTLARLLLLFKLRQLPVRCVSDRVYVARNIAHSDEGRLRGEEGRCSS